MSDVMEIYDLALDMETQLDERKAWHIERRQGETQTDWLPAGELLLSGQTRLGFMEAKNGELAARFYPEGGDISFMPLHVFPNKPGLPWSSRAAGYTSHFVQSATALEDGRWRRLVYKISVYLIWPEHPRPEYDAVAAVYIFREAVSNPDCYAIELGGGTEPGSRVLLEAYSQVRVDTPETDNGNLMLHFHMVTATGRIPGGDYRYAIETSSYEYRPGIDDFRCFAGESSRYDRAVVYDEYPGGLAALKNKNYGTAECTFRACADYGHAEAQLELALLCEKGLGTEKSLAEAEYWLRKAAAQRTSPDGGNRARRELKRLYDDEIAALRDEAE